MFETLINYTATPLEIILAGMIAFASMYLAIGTSVLKHERQNFIAWYKHKKLAYQLGEYTLIIVGGIVFGALVLWWLIC